MAPLFTGNWFNFGRNPSAGGPAPQPFSGTGGEVAAGVSPGNGYTYHYFKTPGNFTVASDYGVVAPGIDVLVIAGGGGGGARSGGGGGAGGIALGEDVPMPVSVAGTNLAIDVGEGGAQNTSGEHSSFCPSTPYGVDAMSGGRGGFDGGSGGVNGGSGGGAQYNSNGGEGLQPTYNGGSKPFISEYGQDGSTGFGPGDHNSGAGGGASGVAGPGGPGYRGTAGNSQNFPDFDVPLWMPAPDPYRPGINPLPGIHFGGGGGAGSHPTNRPQNMPTSATQGGGGIGGPTSNGNGTAGVEGTGGGGGGASGDTPGPAGAAGGAGIIVIRYPVT